MNYYDELIPKIKEKIKAGQFDEARSMIHEEFIVAYVPGAVEEELKELLDEIDALDYDGYSPIKEEELEGYLKGDSAHQLLAVNQLDHLNLRDHLKMIEDYLCSDGEDEIKCILVNSLIDQEINQELKMTKAGMEFTFIPRYILKAEESDGYLKAVEHFEEVFIQNPSMLQMAKELFLKQAFLELPLNYDEDEGLMIAKNMAKYLYRSFNDEEGLKNYEECYENANEIKPYH